MTNILIGLFLFVASSTLGGALLGLFFGLISTAINNFILSPYLGAAHGSYGWWIFFHMQMWAAGAAAVSLSWGIFIAYQTARGLP